MTGASVVDANGLARLCLVTSVLLMTGCSDEEIRSGKLLAEAGGAPAPVRVFPEGPGDGASGSGAGDSGGSGGAAGSGGSNAIPADPPRPMADSEYCGDGVRDPASEECDDGPGVELDSCAQDCQVIDRLVEIWPGSGAIDEFAPDRWLGSGRHPIGAGSQGFAVAYVEPPAVNDFDESPPLVELARFDERGKPLDRISVSEGLFAADSADPVVAALPGGAFAVAYTEFGGDEDELGIALHRLDAGATAPSSVRFANEGTHASQQAPDMVWTGSQLVVAWEDTDSADSGPDLRYRLFDEQLVPLSGDLTLADTPLPEGKVALAPTYGGFAAAWRQGNDDGLETLKLAAWGKLFSVAPHLPGPASDRPAVVEIAPSVLLVVYTVGTDPNTTSVANVGRLYGTLVDITNDPAVELVGQPIYDFDINPYVSQIEPSLVRVGEKLFVAWRSVSYDPAAVPSPEAETLWLKRLYWDTDLQALDTAQPEVRLPRWPEHEYGDQHTPALAASPLGPEGALVMAWTDWGRSFGALEGHPDVVVQFAPTPLVRGDRIGLDCTTATQCAAGEGPCTDDGQCVSGTQCGLDRGPNYNYGVGTGVCSPDQCFDGVLSGNEEDVDCGGDCGHCFDCPDSGDAEFAHFCSGVCRCDALEGDCDSDYECAIGLVCDHDRGKHYGFAHDDLDACVAPHCANLVQDADEEHIDCGGNDCAPCLVGDEDFCQDIDGQRCDVGEGDCDLDGECLSGLVCQGYGPDYGLPEAVDVCIPAACLPENLPPNHTQGHCTTECRCNAGSGICNSDAECQDGLECRDDWAVHYDPQLPFDLPLCVPLHCSNGVQDMGETQIDCGGACGDQCPACEDTAAFASFEDPARSWTTVLGSATPTQSDATHGSTSLLVTACDNNEIQSPPFLTSEWNLVGDQILFDVYIPPNPDNPWWVGQVAIKVNIPAGGVNEQYFAGPQLQNLNWGQWNTVATSVGQSVKDAFLSSDTGTLKVILNIGCAGQGSRQFLVDHVRFGGNTSFRPGCEPGGTGGSGGTSGTGGIGGTGTGTGGIGGTGIGGVGGTGGSSGTGGAGGTAGSGGLGGIGGVGGVGGTGGGATGPAAQILSFESPNYWSPYYQQENNLVTHLNAALKTTIGAWTELDSDLFATENVPSGQYFQIDVYVPQPSGGWGGSIRPILVCPSAGHSWLELGSDEPLLNHPFNAYYSLEWPVPALARQILDGSYTDCRIKLALNGWNGWNQIILDNIRFSDTPLPPPPHSACTGYPQIATPPFVSGGSTIPDGSSALPYRLCTPEQLQTVIDTPGLWGASYILGANLDLTDVVGQIGTFSGNLEGEGYHLMNYGRGAQPAPGGLISLLTGSVSNLGADNFLVHATLLDSVGGFVDDNHGSLSNISFSGVVTNSGGARTALGGLVGVNQGAIMGCQALVNLITPGTCSAGGLVGRLRETGSIVDSSATGNVEKLNANDCSAFASPGGGNSGGGSPSGHALGGLVGYVAGHIGGSTANVSVVSAASSVGGLVGHLDAPGDVQLSQAEGALVTGKGEVGGLVGSATGNLWDSSASCDVEGGDASGGLVGWASGSSIVLSRASGSVTGETRTGGLIGKLTTSSVERCAASGDITKTAGLYVGGLIGASETGSILTDSYAWGDVSGSGLDSAGLIGYAVAGNSFTRLYATGAAERAGLVAVDDGNTSYVDCYWHSDKHTRAVGSLANDPAGTAGRTEAELLTAAGYAGYDFTNVWVIQEGMGYAELQ